MILRMLLCLAGFTLTLLLLASTCHCTGDVSARTIEVSQQQCGKTFEMGKTDTGRLDVYRILMPEGGICPPYSSFVCSVSFKFIKLTNTYPREGRKEVCVDFARMRLYGEGTKVYISNGRGLYSRTVLRSSRYPLISEYLDTVKCFSTVLPINVTFIAPCTKPYGTTLRDYFSSWIYVYFQTKDSDIFHVDGTCRHRERMSSTRIMTLRSFIWKDTAQNEESQSCSIEIKSYSLYYISYTVKLCSEWDFHYTPCGVSVSVQQNKPTLILDDGHSPSFTCNTTHQKISDYKGMDKCTDAGPLRGPFIEVKQNIAPTAVEYLQDGALFFETELRLVKERKYDYDNSDDHDDEVSDTESDRDEVFWKFFLPICIAFSICACACCLNRKKKPNQQPGGPDGGAETQGPFQATQASRPLVPPVPRATYIPYSSGPSRPRQGSDDTGGEGSAENAMAAPPPAYGEVAGIAPPNRHHSSHEETLPSAPALEGSDQDVPPPPFVSQSSGSPPAYHELFPSDT